MDAAIKGAHVAIDTAGADRSGPTLDVHRAKDGSLTKLSLTGATPACGAPSSVTFTVGQNGAVSATATSGFINPEATSRTPHPATKSELQWLKAQVQKSKDLKPFEKAALEIQIDGLIQQAPEKAPEAPRREPVDSPIYMDDPSQIRKLQGQEPVLYAAAPSFPEGKRRV